MSFFPCTNNPSTNDIIKRINKVLGNLVNAKNLQKTNVDDADPWMVILVEATFLVKSTYQIIKTIVQANLCSEDT